MNAADFSHFKYSGLHRPSSQGSLRTGLWICAFCLLWRTSDRKYCLWKLNVEFTLWISNLTEELIFFNSLLFSNDWPPRQWRKAVSTDLPWQMGKNVVLNWSKPCSPDLPRLWMISQGGYSARPQLSSSLQKMADSSKSPAAPGYSFLSHFLLWPGGGDKWGAWSYFREEYVDSRELPWSHPDGHGISWDWGQPHHTLGRCCAL